MKLIESGEDGFIKRHAAHFDAGTTVETYHAVYIVSKLSSGEYKYVRLANKVTSCIDNPIGHVVDESLPVRKINLNLIRE